MKRFKVIAYGSLEDHKSLMEDLPDKKFKKVIVKGYKRVFNLVDVSGFSSLIKPIFKFLRLNLKNNGDKVLNLVKDDNYYFNGVMFSVNENEMIRLKKRELEYNIEEVDVYDFITRKKIGRAFIFIDVYLRISKFRGKPDQKYLELCRNAAYKLGNDFGKVWDKTTFLLSGENVSDYFRRK